MFYCIKGTLSLEKKENVGGSTVQFQVDALCTKTGRARPVFDLPSSLSELTSAAGRVEVSAWHVPPHSLPAFHRSVLASLSRVSPASTRDLHGPPEPPSRVHSWAGKGWAKPKMAKC